MALIDLEEEIIKALEVNGRPRLTASVAWRHCKRCKKLRVHLMYLGEVKILVICRNCGHYGFYVSDLIG